MSKDTKITPPATAVVATAVAAKVRGVVVSADIISRQYGSYSAACNKKAVSASAFAKPVEEQPEAVTLSVDSPGTRSEPVLGRFLRDGISAQCVVLIDR